MFVSVVLFLLLLISGVNSLHSGSSCTLVRRACATRRISTFTPLRMASADEEAAAEEKYKALQAEKRKKYEDKMLRSAEQLTANQAAFFGTVGKFLIPLGLLVVIYSVATGTIVDLPGVTASD
jgi:hypothetical protein